MNPVRPSTNVSRGGANTASASRGIGVTGPNVSLMTASRVEVEKNVNRAGAKGIDVSRDTAGGDIVAMEMTKKMNARSAKTITNVSLAFATIISVCKRNLIGI